MDVSEDLSRYIRCNRLIGEVLTPLMREYMQLTNVPPAAVYQTIMKAYSARFRMKLSQKEMRILQTLLSNGYAHFDITLMYKIARDKNFKMIIADLPTRDWGSQPTFNEITIGDDIERIRLGRDMIMHSPNHRMSEREYNDFFKMFISVGKRADLHFSKANIVFEQTIHDLQYCASDPKTTEILNKTLEENKSLKEFVQKQLFPVSIEKEVEECIEDICKGNDKVPTEIKSMTDERSVELYLKLLESGSEKKRDIRLVAVGEKGAGKTSLIKKLFGEDITDISSTDGIEIHTVKCKANSDDGLWTKVEGSNKGTEIHARLLKPYEEKLQDKEKVEPLVEVGANLGLMDNIPLTDVGESKKSELVFKQPELLKLPDITASHVKPQGTTHQSHQLLEQATRDFETMLADKSNVDLQDKEDYATLLIWDFAGDEEFYHTHQTFLSPDAIYLVVAKLNEAHDKKAQEMFQLWMNSIHCYCRLDKQNNKHECNTLGSEKEIYRYLEPSVVLVGSHKDKVEPLERQEIGNACSDCVISYTDTVSDDAQKHIRGVYYISNTDMSVNDDNVFQKIRQAILVLARKMRTWNTDYPLKFTQLEKRLQEQKKELPIISKDEMKQISLEIPFPLNDEELKLFLKYHHEIRALVYFEDLPNYIVLDTQWLADAFKCIVTADKFRSVQAIHLGTKAWADLNDKGILSSKVLEYILETNTNIFKFEKEQNNYILNVMEKFDIIIRPNISDNDATDDTSQYYVPCMVKARPELMNIYEMFKVEKDNKSAWLCFQFRFLPPHLINHLIASMSRKYEFAECVDSGRNKKKIALFKGLAVFECKQEPAKLQKIFVMTRLNLIQIQVWEFSESAKVRKGAYHHIAEFVTTEINNIISTRFKMSNISFEKKWACGLSITKPECEMLLNNFSKEPILEYRCRKCNENHIYIDEWSERQNRSASVSEI